MKKAFTIAAAALCLMACSGNKEEQKDAVDPDIEKAKRTLERSNHDIDSINKRYDLVKQYMESGKTDKQAEAIVDSIYKASADELQKMREEVAKQVESEKK